MKALVKELASVWGPSGFESQIAAAIRTLITPHVDQVTSDPFGNLIAKRSGTGGKRVMLAAHMDTIGGVVLNISESGLLYCGPVGGFKAHQALGHRALFGNGLRGVIQHEAVEAPKDIEMKKLWVDIGATSRAEAEALVSLGDIFTVEAPLIDLGDRLVAPGLDDRASCAVLIEVARRLEHTAHDMAFVFTAQGEITAVEGPRGAAAAAYGADPDVALVVALTSAGDTQKASGEASKAPASETKLGDGPVLRLKDGQFIAHEGVKSLLIQTADAHNLPLQREVVPSGQGHSDAHVIAATGRGVPAGVITIPARYRSTAGEMVSLADMEGAVNLILKALGGPMEV